jgi:3-dehydrosphinganine reductase
MLYSDSVKVHTVFPGSIDTPGFAHENIGKPAITKILEEPDPLQSADAVATAAISGLESGEYLITTNLLGSIMRASAWGSSVRNNWFIDNILVCIVALVSYFISADLNGKVRKYGKTNGHPATFKA